MKNTHGHKGTPVHEHTAARIEHYIRKHRASGGKAESPMHGEDDAEEDIREKPERYNRSKVEDEAEARKAKKGGKIVKAEGEKARKHAGRKRRAAGGGCESHPFSTALKGSGPRVKKEMKESEGEDE